jgi:dihydrofolate synthase/folylpolyglutamate synthase
MESNVLKEAGAAAGLKGEAFDTVEKAVKKALADSSEKDIIFIGGSTFVVADLMATVKKTIPN